MTDKRSDTYPYSDFEYQLGLLGGRKVRHQKEKSAIDDDKDSHHSQYLQRNAWTESLDDVSPAQPGVFLEIWEHRYKKSKNPLYAWLAFQQARKLDLTVPEWILDYFLNSADNLLEISGELADKTQAAIAEALGLKTDGGGSQFKRFRDEERNRQIYRRVQELRQDPQFLSNKKINEMIAAEFGLSSGSVQKIFDNFSAFLHKSNK